MKKNIILSAAFVLLCLTNLLAQDGTTVNSAAAKSFEKKFSGATEVSWEPQDRGISLARFHYKNDVWVAYFSSEGTVITSGRKVKSTDALPLKVKESLEKSQSKFEGKYGTFALGSIFEMVNEDGAVAYYVPMQNSQASVMLTISGDGFSTTRKKELHPTAQPNPSAIAKTN